MKMRIFYEAVAGAAGGAGLQPSMKEIREAAAAGKTPGQLTPPVVVIPVNNGGITGAPEGGPVLPNAAEEEARQKLAAENIAKGLNPDGSPKTAATETKTAEQLATEAANVTAGKNPDGTEIVAATEMTDDEMVADFFAKIDAKSGMPVKVEYPAGVDPLSPDGVYIRDQVVREQAKLEFQQSIRAGNPRGYAYMLHLENGGTDEEFLGKGVGLSLPERTLVETDVAAQTMLMKLDLKAKGIDDDTITTIVEKAVKDNKLKEKSLLAYDGIATDQKNQLLLIEQREQQSIAREQQLSTAFFSSADKIMPNMRLIVPDADKPGFKAFMDENVRIDNGQIYLIKPINAENLQQTMEAMFLMFKNGDLSKIVQKQAATLTSQRLRTSLDATKITGPKSGTETKVLPSSVPLKDIWKKRAQLSAAGQ